MAGIFFALLLLFHSLVCFADESGAACRSLLIPGSVAEGIPVFQEEHPFFSRAELEHVRHWILNLSRRNGIRPHVSYSFIDDTVVGEYELELGSRDALLIAPTNEEAAMPKALAAKILSRMWRGARGRLDSTLDRLRDCDHLTARIDLIQYRLPAGTEVSMIPWHHDGCDLQMILPLRLPRKLKGGRPQFKPRPERKGSSLPVEVEPRLNRAITFDGLRTWHQVTGFDLRGRTGGRESLREILSVGIFCEPKASGAYQ